MSSNRKICQELHASKEWSCEVFKHPNLQLNLQVNRVDWKVHSAKRRQDNDKYFSCL